MTERAAAGERAATAERGTATADPNEWSRPPAAQQRATSRDDDDDTTRGSASSVAVADVPGAATAADSPVEQGTRLAKELAAGFREHVRRAIGMPLDDSETSLAYVDHYLRTVRNETRAPIVALIAAEAGAYYGELVRATIDRKSVV